MQPRMSLPPEPPALRTVDGPSPTATSFARVLAHRPPEPSPTTTVAPHGVLVPAWTPTATLLQAYRDVVGSATRMPLTFPALIGVRLHRDLMGHGTLPVSGLGMVHVATEMWSSGRLPLDAPWQVSAWADGTRNTRSGLEIDLWARCSGGDATWTARIVVLSRSRSARGEDDSAAPELPVITDSSTTTMLVAQEGTGRAFARVSGDVNPIHLHALTAKPFGFKRAIAHGWWSLPRALALLGADSTPEHEQRYLDVTYRRPVLLPSRPTLLGEASGEDLRFLAVRDDDKPYFGGRLHSNER